MGHVLSREGFSRAIKRIGKTRRIYAPQLKRGEGRFTDVDVVRYDFTDDVDAMELVRRSDYPFKEVLTPLSQTLFFFTEEQVKIADVDEREVVVVLRACDLNAVRRLDAAGGLVAFTILRPEPDRWEVERTAVAAEHRRRGPATYSDRRASCRERV